MSSELGLLTLRVLHVVAGVVWVGSSVFLAAFLFPSVRAVGPAGGPVMRQLAEVRRLPVFLLGSSIVGIGSGLALYWRDTGGFQHNILLTGPGLGFGVGGTLAVLAAVLGVTVNSPTGKRIAALSAELQAAGRPPTMVQLEEMQRLQRRVGLGSLAGSTLLVSATVAMAVARYLP